MGSRSESSGEGTKGRAEEKREAEREMKEWAGKVGQPAEGWGGGGALTHSSALSSGTSQRSLLW